ncbi:unnamed protein product [Brassica rapa]|uniref:Uncharacterized protein n=1 Tax=Brassica campestris TaxID=3711 RepID=A0A8D9LMK0_BRACM|nr:unnamed protein product [Brassica rapa]
MQATINSNRRLALSIQHSIFIKATVYKHLIKVVILLMLCLQDVIKARMEICSRVLQGLAFNTVV